MISLLVLENFQNGDFSEPPKAPKSSEDNLDALARNMRIQFAKMPHIDETTPEAMRLLTPQTQSTRLNDQFNQFFAEQYRGADSGNRYALMKIESEAVLGYGRYGGANAGCVPSWKM
eukprot:GHVO01037271.1.p1 GENE.GHVO01037271.1~~GHVO01037271.1.p1  ORF type:complete len:117 (-),score=12.31 GHVO01037271.1:781-1131(-)